MNAVSIKQQVKILITDLRSKNVVSIHSKLPQHKKLVEKISEFYKRIPKGSRRADVKSARIIVDRLYNSLHETLHLFETNQLLRDEMEECADSIESAFKDHAEYINMSQAEPNSFSIVSSAETLATAFTRSKEDAKQDSKLFRTKYRKTKDLPDYHKDRRHVLVHAAPGISDGEINQTDIPFMRIVEGYCFLPNQRILVVHPSKVVGGADPYEVINKMVGKMKGNFVLAPDISIQSGMIYAWVMESNTYDVLFGNRVLNAWVSVSKETQQ